MGLSRAKLSVIVPTGNREDVIEECLKSVRWADEVIVVDSISTDATFGIAQKYADRILKHEYGFSARQKNWAIPQAAHEWVLIVDTDERIHPDLREEIETMLTSPQEHSGFRIPRVNLVLGKPVLGAGYYPDYQIRLFRRDKSCYQMRRVHAHMVVDGSVGTLKAPIIHYAHRSLDQMLRNLLVLMTTWEAEERLLQQTEKSTMFAMASIVFNLLTRPIAAFCSRFLVQGGWREGMHGLSVSMVWGMYIAITYMKIWERDLDLPAKWWESDWETRLQASSRKINHDK